MDFGITLDGKPIRTPSARQVVVPARALADAVAAEWAAQGEAIDPVTMPLTRIANSVVEGVVDRVELVTDDLAKYLETDLLFYRAGHPEGLVAREAAHWDPVLFWAAEALGAHFILSEGIMHVKQPDEALRAARAALPGDAWSVAALHVVTTLTGSALLALALAHGVRDAGQVWAAAHVDEDWNADQWGVDEEAAARRSTRLRDFDAAVAVLAAVNPHRGQRSLTRGLRRGPRVGFALPGPPEMPTPISSIAPVSAASPVADAATSDLVLQAGSVVDARVVSVLADNLVRIAIANLSMDVMSEVSLTPGQNLQLAVSQNDGTIRLAVVNGAGEASADQVTLTPTAASLVDSPSLAPSRERGPQSPDADRAGRRHRSIGRGRDQAGQPGAAVRQSGVRRDRQRFAGRLEAGRAGCAGATDAAQHCA